MCQMVGQMADAAVAAGTCDPAFAHAAHAVDFFWARPWNPNGANNLSKPECLARQREWNGAVDSYIASGRDARPRLEIERAAKVAWSGGPMLHPCANAECGKVESAVGEFSACGKCKKARYHSQQCQKAGPSAHHAVWRTTKHSFPFET